jgi:cystathionine beta-lyase/cystathionine gamma-synthase
LPKGDPVTDYSRRFETLETNLVHAGRAEPRWGDAVVSPIFQSANFLSADETTYDSVRYGRLSNSPSHQALQARLAAIEGGEAALVSASGMAAITASILAFAGSGDHLLTAKTLYGGTQGFLDREGRGLGLTYTAIDLADPKGVSAWEQWVRPETRVVYVEAISNPLVEVGDLERVAAFARDLGLVSVIDGTFASPVNFRPLEHGFDLVVHSATKYLNGHSDLIAGVVAGSAERIAEVRRVQNHLGGSLDAFGCYLLERGLKTLALRVARQNASALALAQRLAERPEVRRVNYPGLESDPGHRFAARLFSGFGGMLSFYADSVERAELFLDRLTIPVHAASLGGLETLVVRPSRSSHLGQTAEERERLGITDDLIRVSVGIEDLDELAADFVRALS